MVGGAVRSGFRIAGISMPWAHADPDRIVDARIARLSDLALNSLRRETCSTRDSDDMK